LLVWKPKKNSKLKIARENQRAFFGFQEGPLSFAPTYKYDIGTDVYDTSEKMRIPAWTDRILFSGKCINQLYYDRVEINSSDHRPVKSLFEIEVIIPSFAVAMHLSIKSNLWALKVIEVDPIQLRKLEKEIFETYSEKVLRKEESLLPSPSSPFS